MTLPASGPISFNQINVELGVAGTTTASLGQASYRTLAGVPSGAISMSNFYGKSNRKAISYTFTASTANASLNVAAISGYVAGVSDITVTVNTSVYLYSTSTGTPGLTLSGGTTGDTLTLVNNGFIMGMGGAGAPHSPATTAPSGGIALQLGFPITINNTNPVAYIGGGGGGGGRGGAFGGGVGGGGGAGGGAGGPGQNALGGAGGGLGASGSPGVYNGTWPNAEGKGGGAGGGGASGQQAPRSNWQSGGGGGGRIFPGSGGAGGLGAGSPTGGAGGSANAAGGPSPPGFAGGGGGGWGASGGSGQQGAGAGGKAVNLNGRTVTWVSGNTTRVYGAVS